MDKDLQYYLNNTKNNCVTIPSRKCDYLTIQKYLSEFKTQEEKQKARDNLGVTDELKTIKNIIDNKVIEVGGVSWDTEPTEGHTEQVLSSDTIWKVLQNFKSNQFIDNLIQTLWNNILSRIDKIDQDIKEDLQEFIPTFIKNEINKYIQDLQNQIDALDIHGIAVSNKFGTDKHIAISQKTMTDAINKLWQKLEEITGEIYQGINMVVTPDYFISEDGATVHITASTVEANGIFEHIAFYGNGTLISEASNVDYFELDHHINETTIIMCKAKILGVEYSRQHVITHYNSFWIGAGDTYQDIMDVEHVIPITEGLRGSHNVDVPEGKHIIIIMGDTFRSEFMRADISFAEILFNEFIVTVDGKNYSVLVSQDTYQAGTYNVFING